MGGNPDYIQQAPQVQSVETQPEERDIFKEMIDSVYEMNPLLCIGIFVAGIIALWGSQVGIKRWLKKRSKSSNADATPNS